MALFACHKMSVSITIFQKTNSSFTQFLSTGSNPWLSGFWFLGCTLGRELPQLPPALTEFKKKAVPGCSPVSKSPNHPSVFKQYRCIYCTPTFLFQSALRFCHIVDVVIELYTWCNVVTLPSYFNTGQHCTQQLSWTWTQQTTTLLELENVSHPVILPTYMTRIWYPVASGLKFLCLFSLYLMRNLASLSLHCCLSRNSVWTKNMRHICNTNNWLWEQIVQMGLLTP